MVWVAAVLAGLLGVVALGGGYVVAGYSRYLRLHQTERFEDFATVPLRDAPLQPLFVHVSDTHFVGQSRCRVDPTTKKERCRTFEGSPWTPDALLRLRDELLRLRPEFVLISGDVTDTGALEEWRRAEQTLLSPLRGARIQVIVGPGTHDLQPAFVRDSKLKETDREIPVLRDEADAIAQRRFVEVAASELGTVDQGPIRALLDKKPTRAAIERHHWQQFQACMDGCRAITDGKAHTCGDGCAKAVTPALAEELATRAITARACREWYPLLHHDRRTGVLVVVLCSSGEPTSWIWEAAIGSFGAGQLDRLQKIVEAITSGTRYVVVMLHHTPARPSDDVFGFPKRWWPWAEIANSPAFMYSFLGANWQESRRLIDTLSNAAKDRVFLVAYGHRHVRHLGRVHDRVITSEVSAAYDGGSAVGLCYRAPEPSLIQCGTGNL